MLLEAGADVNATNADGYTALQLVQKKIFKRSGDKKIIEMLKKTSNTYLSI